MQLKSIVLTALGLLFLVLGAIGLFVPVWPTTPFVLLSVACCSSAPRVRALIMQFPFFREHYENYQHRRGLSKKITMQSLIWLWGMLLISMYFVSKVWLQVLLTFVGLAVTVHILWMAKGRGKDV